MPHKVALVALAFLVLAAVPAGAQTPLPPLPTLPPGLPKAETARFAVTVRGYQSDLLRFDFDAVEGLDCSIEGRGELSEQWHFERGKGVVLTFTKLGPGAVVLQRAGRGLGDSAFAAPGDVERRANGSIDNRAPIDCVSFPLATRACNQVRKVRPDLDLSWAKGKLELTSSSTENTQPNPLRGCGLAGGFDFDIFSYRFPGLLKQKGALPMKRIFDSKRNLKVELKPRFLESAEVPPGYNDLSETVSGSTTVTLRRLKR